jgi:hypothetical protein
LLRIDGEDFLAALSESAPSGALYDGVSGRLARTHPSYRTVYVPEEPAPKPAKKKIEV